jgi:hypothetical protein
MDGVRSNRRTDERLDAIRFETGEWVVTGANGKVSCSAASLQFGIVKAAHYPEVAAPARLPSDDIIVFPGPIERLRQTTAIRELPPAPSELLKA